MPDPVGAMTRVFSPLPMAAQACAWAWVGAANAEVNQSRVTALNLSSGSLLPAAWRVLSGSAGVVFWGLVDTS